MNLASFRSRLIRLPVRQSEFEIGIAQENCDRIRAPMHHKFVVSAVLDSQDLHLIILQLHAVVFRIDPDRIGLNQAPQPIPLPMGSVRAPAVACACASHN